MSHFPYRQSAWVVDRFKRIRSLWTLPPLVPLAPLSSFPLSIWSFLGCFWRCPSFAWPWPLSHPDTPRVLSYAQSLGRRCCWSKLLEEPPCFSVLWELGHVARPNPTSTQWRRKERTPWPSCSFQAGIGFHNTGGIGLCGGSYWPPLIICLLSWHMLYLPWPCQLRSATLPPSLSLLQQVKLHALLHFQRYLPAPSACLL